MLFICYRYGDKTPRSFFGRLFGVLWILLGVIVITMFTATVTSALTHSSSPEFTSALEGQKVSKNMKLKTIKVIFQTTLEFEAQCNEELLFVLSY